MENTSSPSIRTWSSSRVKIVRTLLPSSLILILYGVIYLPSLVVTGMTPGIALSIVLGLTLLAVATLNISAAVTVELSDTQISIRSGFAVFRTKPKRIPLKHIHTIHILGMVDTLRGGLQFGGLHIAFKWPSRKMLYAEAQIPLQATPNALELIQLLAERTEAKFKVNNGAMSQTTVSHNELLEMLGLSSKETTELDKQSSDEVTS